jgi:hypothetical protein
MLMRLSTGVYPDFLKFPNPPLEVFPVPVRLGGGGTADRSLFSFDDFFGTKEL